MLPYVLLRPTPQRLLLAPDLAFRRTYAAISALFGASVLWAAYVTYRRTPQDWPSWGFLLLVGLGLLALATTLIGCWIEIEAYADQARLLRRRHFYGRTWIVESLPFAQIRDIRVRRLIHPTGITIGGALRFIQHDGKLWATTSFSSAYRADQARQELLEFLHMSTSAKETS